MAWYMCKWPDKNTSPTLKQLYLYETKTKRLSSTFILDHWIKSYYLAQTHT